jgi:hypothetical protein
MTVEEALRLLDAHRGDEVTAVVETALGDWVTGVVTMRGTLTAMRHPQGRAPAVPAPSGASTDLYDIGTGCIYLPTGVIGEIRESIADPGIEIALPETTSIRIAWGDRRPERPDRRQRRAAGRGS